MKPDRPPKLSPLQIALVGNLKEKLAKGIFDPPDAGAEFDRSETIQAITAALESENHSVLYFEADKNLPDMLKSFRPDICFNIAEGYRCEGREALVPALCELMGIPYTASGVVANAISLDKTKTKQIWSNLGLPVADFQEIRSLESLAENTLKLPLIVKPAREGTGMGIDDGALVRTKRELFSRVDWVLQTYQEPALIEEYLPGREFTVGFIGNQGDPSHRLRSDLYDQEGYHWFPVLEINSNISVTPGLYGHYAKEFYIGEVGAPDYLCPAEITDQLKEELIYLAKRAAQAIDAYDVSRVDFRLRRNGEPCLMEINTLPGLTPNISDLCFMGDAEGLKYETIITEILHLALERYGLFSLNKRFRLDQKTVSAVAGNLKN